MTILLRWGAGLLLSGMLFCSNQIGGGIGHEGEARVAGRVVYPDTGRDPAGAAVYMHSASFTSDTSSAGNTRVPDALLDADGRFAINSVAPGEYVIEVNDGDRSGACIRFGVAEKFPEVIIPDDTLRHFGTIRGKLVLDSAGDAPVYLQVYGLDRLTVIDSHTDSFTIDDVPTGTYVLHILSAADSSAPKNIDGVLVHPGGITDISIAYRSVDSLATRMLRVRLNTSATGAAISASVYDFPVLVRLSADDFDFSRVRSDGADVRFVKTDGTPLPFEIETWDADLQQACIWVRVDTVFGDDTAQSFVMRWGDADSPATASSPVFDTARGFLASYHFGGTLDDATQHGHDGIDSGTADTADGIIGRARIFNGSQFFSIGDLPDRERGTISCWFRPKSAVSAASATTQGLWGKKETESTNYTLSLGGSDFYLADRDARGRLISKLENSNEGYYLLSATAAFNAHEWYFVSWSWGDGGDSLFVNGALEASTPHSVTLTGTGAEEVGRSFYDPSTNILYGGPKYFSGTLDELRIDNTCRSAVWIKLCYMNQREDDALVEVVKE
ncbi:MAG: DUF2341 domain-containing protein [Chitinispirillaceae bacterium]|nr:DUF2341 domain-containing protein [Chitinispirillaceae bacterium]